MFPQFLREPPGVEIGPLVTTGTVKIPGIVISIPIELWCWQEAIPLIEMFHDRRILLPVHSLRQSGCCCGIYQMPSIA